MNLKTPCLRLKRTGGTILAELRLALGDVESGDCSSRVETAKEECLKRWKGLLTEIGALRPGGTTYDMVFDVVLHPDVQL